MLYTRNIKLFYFAILLISASNSLLAIKYSNQNILVTRAPGKDMYLRELAWSEVKRDAENFRNCLFASSFQLNFFYQKLSSKKDLGSYFGVMGKGTGITYKGGFGTGTVGVNLNSEYFVHDAIRDNYEFSSQGKLCRYKKPDNAHPYGTVIQIGTTGGAPIIDPLTSAPALSPTTENSTNLKLAYGAFSDVLDGRAMQGTIDLQTDRRVWGALLSYYAYTKGGFWIQFDLPILQIKNSLIPVIKTEQRLLDQELGRDVSMLDLICGDYSLPEDATDSNNDNPNAQNKLLYSKFSKNVLEKSGVGDLDITFGYRLANHEQFDFDAFFKLSIPTAEEISPEFIFSPQLGSNGHFILSIGACCNTDIWKSADWCIEARANHSVSYAFPKNQNRTLTSLVDRSVALPWDKYILLQGSEEAGPLSPGANILTTEVKVSPGFSTETILSLDFRGHSFVGSLGVSVFTRQGENVEIKSWGKNGLYNKPSLIEYRTTEDLVSTSFSFENLDVSSITQSKLSTMPASTPGSLSASFFSQVGYFDQDPNMKPFTACLGFAYEVCNDNSALNHFTFWIKAGIAF